MSYKLDVKLSKELEPYRSAIEATIKPYIKIELTNNNKPTWWQSKFGGLPYIPKGFDYPKSYDGEYLYLLAQINFAEAPSLKGFPDDGILQFYITADYGYGKKYYHSLENIERDILQNTEQDTFRVLYFDRVTFDVNNLTTDFSFLPSISDTDSSPIQGCCAIDFVYKVSPVGIRDYKFDIFPVSEASDSIYYKYKSKFPTNGHKIGGYPHFTQDDPRFLLSQKQPYILLFQIDSDENKSIEVLWGDCGVCNFFIKKSALKKLDFTEVLYNWDCC